MLANIFVVNVNFPIFYNKFSSVWKPVSKTKKSMFILASEGETAGLYICWGWGCWFFLNILQQFTLFMKNVFPRKQIFSDRLVNIFVGRVNFFLSMKTVLPKQKKKVFQRVMKGKQLAHIFAVKVNFCIFFNNLTPLCKTYSPSPPPPPK